MFVIMQSLHNLENPLNSNVVEVISESLSRSGVAITVTSLTDVLAFGVGASTVSIFSAIKKIKNIIFGLSFSTVGFACSQVLLYFLRSWNLDCLLFTIHIFCGLSRFGPEQNSPWKKRIFALCKVPQKR